jgi:hypothetical protein
MNFGGLFHNSSLFFLSKLWPSLARQLTNLEKKKRTNYGPKFSTVRSKSVKTKLKLANPLRGKEISSRAHGQHPKGRFSVTA